MDIGYKLINIVSRLILIGLFFLCLKGVSAKLIREVGQDDELISNSRLEEERMEYPLSQLLVPVKKDSLAVYAGEVSWLKYTRPDNLEAEAGSIETFNSNVSHNGLAEKLLELYKGDERLFEWDKVEGELELNGEGKYLYVPSWIAFELFRPKNEEK